MKSRHSCSSRCLPFQRLHATRSPATNHGAMFPKPVAIRLVSDVVEKKHRLVVEVESLVSSAKKITTPRREDGVVVVNKNVKSRRTFNKNSSDLLTGYSNNAH